MHAALSRAHWINRHAADRVNRERGFRALPEDELIEGDRVGQVLERLPASLAHRHCRSERVTGRFSAQHLAGPGGVGNA
jgi:hypothetical protein